MVELKSTANSANSREKKISAICVIRGEKFTSWYTHHAKSQRPDDTFIVQAKVKLKVMPLETLKR